MAYLLTLALLAPASAKLYQPTEIPLQGLSNSIRGPHITANFPDPGLFYQDGTTYAFATNNRKPRRAHINVQVATSNDNTTWAIEHGLDALPKTATWQTGGAVWAPDVKQLPSGQYILYYTDSLVHQPQTHCIGAAVSSHITGPYEPLHRPLICPHGGAIDPAGFYDSSTNRRYIIYKIDGNSLGHGGSCNNDVMPLISTPLMLQEVDNEDGLSFIGEPVKLLDRDAIDGPLIEAPAMHRTSDGVYFLFYSANCYTGPLYHTSYATATDITGPYTKAGRPLFITGDYDGLTGPGGMDILEDARGGAYIAFHGIMNIHNDPSRLLTDVRGFDRGMYTGRIRFDGRTATTGVGFSALEPSREL